MGWRKVYPGVEVEHVEADRNVVLADLDAGEIDVAILTGPGSQDRFRCERLWSERIMVALPTTHPLTKRGTVHWTDLSSERFHLPATDPGPELHAMLLGRLSASVAIPDIRVHRASQETILSILGGSPGIGIVCEGSTRSDHPEIVYRPLHGEQGPALIGLSGHWRSDNHNPALRRFLRFVRDQYGLSFGANSRRRSIDERPFCEGKI